MAEFDLTQDVLGAPKPKDVKDREADGHEHTSVARAIEHGRPDALGPRGALHLQRAAGNAAMGALVQRQPEEDSPVHKVVGGGGGSRLDDGVRSKMESSLGFDFSGVRVHTGTDAAAAAKSVQAQAFTVGSDVVFNEGKYNPSSPEGQRTIAHELTHVVQQSQGEVPGESTGAGVKVSDPSDWAEQQAEATADAVMGAGREAIGGQQGPSPGGSSVQTLPLQRDDDELQALAEPAVQREPAGKDENPEEDETAMALLEPGVQRESEDEEENLGGEGMPV